jgi:hypothetical protein
MAHFEVLVQWEDGSPATGRRVSLGFWSGVTDYEYTDSRGVAIVSTGGDYGEATVYVDGWDRGTMRPGRKVVTIRS